jgi:hypothetical protein
VWNKKGEKHRNKLKNKKEARKRGQKEEKKRCFFFQKDNLTCKFIMS